MEHREEVNQMSIHPLNEAFERMYGIDCYWDVAGDGDTPTSAMYVDRDCEDTLLEVPTEILDELWRMFLLWKPELDV